MDAGSFRIVPGARREAAQRTTAEVPVHVIYKAEAEVPPEREAELPPERGAVQALRDEVRSLSSSFEQFRRSVRDHVAGLLDALSDQKADTACAARAPFGALPTLRSRSPLRALSPLRQRSPLRQPEEKAEQKDQVEVVGKRLNESQPLDQSMRDHISNFVEAMSAEKARSESAAWSPLGDVHSLGARLKQQEERADLFGKQLKELQGQLERAMKRMSSLAVEATRALRAEGGSPSHAKVESPSTKLSSLASTTSAGDVELGLSLQGAKAVWRLPAEALAGVARRKHVASPEIALSGKRFQLRFFPRGDSESMEGRSSIYCDMLDSGRFGFDIVVNGATKTKSAKHWEPGSSVGYANSFECPAEGAGATIALTIRDAA